jgi:hypothetical protein
VLESTLGQSWAHSQFLWKTFDVRPTILQVKTSSTCASGLIIALIKKENQKRNFKVITVVKRQFLVLPLIDCAMCIPPLITVYKVLTVV